MTFLILICVWAALMTAVVLLMIGIGHVNDAHDKAFYEWIRKCEAENNDESD